MTINNQAGKSQSENKTPFLCPWTRYAGCGRMNNGWGDLRPPLRVQRVGKPRQHQRRLEPTNLRVKSHRRGHSANGSPTSHKMNDVIIVADRIILFMVLNKLHAYFSALFSYFIII